MLTEKQIARFYLKFTRGADDQCWLWTAGCFQGSGYGFFNVGGVEGKRPRLAHRVAYELAYNVTLTREQVVMHHCDQKRCVNPSHLLLGTQADNLRDMIAKGRSLRGERHPNVKLDQAKADEIRARYAAGGVTQRGLAAEFGVTQGAVAAILRNESWTENPNRRQRTRMGRYGREYTTVDQAIPLPQQVATPALPDVAPLPHRYRGVARRKDQNNRPWLARIIVKRKQINLGSFHTAEEAASVYDIAARKHFGEFARCNFSEQWAG